MAVALKDLGGDGCGFKAEGGDDGFFVLGFELAEGAYGTGDFSDTKVLGGCIEPIEVAPHLRVPEEEFHAEGGGLSVDAVGPADGWGCAEIPQPSCARRCEGGQCHHESMQMLE